VATYWESVITMNNYQKRRFAMKVVSSMFNTVSGKKLAVLGFSYKKNTSDTRHSVAIDVRVRPCLARASVPRARGRGTHAA
jgi:UDPglucose 6-dehydrogenase